MTRLPITLLLIGITPLLLGHTSLKSGGGQTTQPQPASVLYLWAGDQGPEAASPTHPDKTFDVVDDQDFLAVVDADPNSRTYGAVLRTVSVLTPPAAGNEPHHMQPFTPSVCNTVFGGGLFSDFWHNFDISDPLRPKVAGIITPVETRGTVPDAAFVLPNCQALGTEMGEDVATGSHPAGPHGTVIRMGAAGAEVLEEQLADRVPTDSLCHSQWEPVAQADKPGGPFTRKTSPDRCLPSNPHGIWARPDLNTLLTADFATPARLILPAPTTTDALTLTIRHYQLNPACTGQTTPSEGTECIGEPRVVLLPDGPRQEANEGHEENVGPMEVTTTHPAGALNPTGATPTGFLPSKGAFSAPTCGGALHYTPDITAERPEWREVFDFTAVRQAINPRSETTAGCTSGGGLVVTADNRMLVHSIIGREPGQGGGYMVGGAEPFPGAIVLLDIEKLISSGTDLQCNIDTTAEVLNGGAERDCPTVADIHVVDDQTSGGPHFFSLDFPNGGQRLAFFDYFVSETGIAGDLRVCMMDIQGRQLTLDERFPATANGQKAGRGCISFNRADWPEDRGAGAGPAKPHYGLFRNTR